MSLTSLYLPFHSKALSTKPDNSFPGEGFLIPAWQDPDASNMWRRDAGAGPATPENNPRTKTAKPRCGAENSGCFTGLSLPAAPHLPGHGRHSRARHGRGTKQAEEKDVQLQKKIILHKLSLPRMGYWGSATISTLEGDSQVERA